MNDAPQNFFKKPARGEWVRLRTFIYLRWLAVFGQSGAVIAGLFFLNLDLKLELISFFILLSASINILATLLYPENKRLSEKDIFLLLMYDLIQLCILLSLTGGLTNPFSVLVLAPVTISATALRLSSTLILGGIAGTLITILGFFYIPLNTKNNLSLDSEILLIGTWLALLITVIFLAGYARRVTVEMSSMSEALLATQMALEREQRLTALGGVVAAMAHELGTPLSTIKLASSEILNERNLDLDLREDIELINAQVDRCRDILHDMGRRGKDDTHLHVAPLLSLMQEAIEPHQDRGKSIIIIIDNWSGDIFDNLQFDGQPNVYRRPEIIHGIRNLVENAVDFAQSKVWIQLDWKTDRVLVKISDDGFGFPSEMIGRLGDPFVNKKLYKNVERSSQKYEGMGLGLFIAKTLLERTGAKVTFSNSDMLKDERIQGVRQEGAIVKVVWSKNLLEATGYDSSNPLPENKRN
ncbi:MAG: two-component sensor histidine kinase [Rhodobiaceae bacterium]|nr:two-component sensor histidine kinase [Rhodobiaceae bacterium]